MELEAITRQEQIIAGKDLQPVTRMEFFLKAYGGGGSSGGGSVPKPLTFDYMPEGYPTKTVQTTTLMEEQQVAFTLSNGVYMAPITNALEIVDGQTYTVNWDGTEYECVGVVIESQPVLGNLSFVDKGSDTGEPFVYTYNTKRHTGMFATLDASASHTISVKTTEEIVTPMAEEFLRKDVIVNIVGEEQGGGGNTYLLFDKTDEEINNALNNGSTVKLNYYGSNLQYDLNNEMFWGVIPHIYGTDGIVKLAVVSVSNLANGWYSQKTYIAALTTS